MANDLDRGYEARTPPITLRDDRSIIRYFLYSTFTCGIYAVYFMYHLIKDINVLCKESGRKIPGLVPYILLSLVTLGIYAILWWFRVAVALEEEARRRKVSISMTPGIVLLAFAMSYTCAGIAGLVGMHYVFETVNELAGDYNIEQRRRFYYETTPAEGNN